MLNQWVGIGRLTKDIELKSTQTGKSVVNFSFAVDKGKDNLGNDLGANFINCVAWGKTAELLNTYTKKGSKLLVQGELTSRNYQDNTGRTVYVVEVVVNRVEFLDTRQQTTNQFSTVDDYVEQQVEVSSDSLPF